MGRWLVAAALATLAITAQTRPVTPAAAQAPDSFFGIRIGADGELARYPKIVDYLTHLSKTSPRVKFEELGKTTMGNPYVLATISSPENLAKLQRLIDVNRRLADPRGLSDAEAARLADEGRAFYFVYGTIHSTEVGNTQSLIEIAHRLATENSPDVKEILDNVVVLLVPSQNPDGQVLVIDHWYKTKGTPFTRVYPDLYHKYVGHDDNRDWFMFTQKETRLAIGIQNKYKPVITHDMHQKGGGARIFVPPYDDPYDPNIHPILAEEMTSVGQAMATALIANGQAGVESVSTYDLWAPARQYMVYHGQPRILTEIASVNLADPIVDSAPIGPQDARWNFPMPYRGKEWHLRQIVDYGNTVAFAGMSHVAKYRRSFLENFYRVHADWVNRKAAPYAFVVPSVQRDLYETYELIDILRLGDVEVHKAQSPFIPEYPGRERFQGRQLHTKDYRTADEFRGRHVVVVGGGISAIQLLDEISLVTTTTWVTRREPQWRDTPFDEAAGRAAVAIVEDRVRRGLPPGSVVSVTGLPVTARVEAMRARGVLERVPMFTEITERGVRWDDGRELDADVILWCTGFRSALDHLAPLMLRDTETGGIVMTGRLATQVAKDPRIHLVGYGPSASTIGANRAGAAAATELLQYLTANS